MKEWNIPGLRLGKSAVKDMTKVFSIASGVSSNVL